MGELGHLDHVVNSENQNKTNEPYKYLLFKSSPPFKFKPLYNKTDHKLQNSKFQQWQIIYQTGKHSSISYNKRKDLKFNTNYQKLESQTRILVEKVPKKE